MQLSAPLYILKRNAHRLAREQALPLHQALDQIARGEGYGSWSLLVSQAQFHQPAHTALAQFADGDLVLVGARPQQGKTLFCVQLCLAAMQDRRHCYFFSLDYLYADMQARFTALGQSLADHQQLFHFDDSDEICADYIIAQLPDAPAGSLVVVDYLQALELDRRQPPLSQQLPRLQQFVQQRGLQMVFISQIDRHCVERLPTTADIKQSNPLDMALFDRTCFLHGGQLRLSA